MRVGLIGCGAIGELRARALDGRGGGPRLSAVTDADPGRARLFASRFGARAFTSPAELLASGEVDAAVVSTPPSSHAEAVYAALASGMAVLCEKPLAPDSDAARGMVEAARKAGRPLLCGFNHRFFPAVRAVREAVASGRLGAIDHVRAYAGHGGASEFTTSWMTDPKVVGGGALMDNGIHVLDLVRHFAGEIAEVAARVSSRIYGLPVEEHGVVQMVTSGGVLAELEASWTDWNGYSWWVEVHGDRGLARAAYPPMRAVVAQRNDAGRARRRWSLFPKLQIAERLGSWRATVVSTFRQEHEELARTVATGEAPRIAATGEDGARAVAVVAAAYESSRTGRIVRL
jgi:predicted dehydrogenase